MAQIRDRAPSYFTVTSDDYQHERSTRPGVTADSMIQEETEAMAGEGPDAEHRVVWCVTGGIPRVVAVVMPGENGVPVVVRLDAKGGVE